MNISTNTTKLPPRPEHDQVAFIAQMTSLAVLAAIIVLGNLASIITFVKTQSLRRRSHYLIISLSAADLLVGVGAFMSVYFFLNGSKLNTYAFALDFLDTLTVMASVFTLSTISIERFSAILFPFRHRMLRFRVYVALAALPWILATFLAVLSLIGHFKRSVYFAFIQICFVIVGLALLTILISYISMGCKMKRKSNVRAQNQNRALRDKKLVITLLNVTLSSLLTWMPLQIFFFVKIFCSKCPLPDSTDIFIMKFLQFCNSGLNIFIYIVRMPEFRVAFLAIFCRRKERSMKRRSNTMQKTNQAFTSEEETQGTPATFAQSTEFDDMQDISEQNSFNEPNNVKKNNTNHGNNNIAVFSQGNNKNSQKKCNGEGEGTLGKPNLEKTKMPMIRGNDEALPDSKEREILQAHHENVPTPSKYEIAHDNMKGYDTRM